jgi:hypothetical protein
MTTKTLNIILVVLSAGLSLALYLSLSLSVNLDCTMDQASNQQVEKLKKKLQNKRYHLSQSFQSSGSYLTRVATLEACLDPDDQTKQKALTLIQDLNIKSSSYSVMNKLFFLFSLLFAFCIISFPIITSIVSADSKAARIFSPTQLPAITLLAALCFGLYTDYKGKQTSAENLIRYVYTEATTEKIAEISSKVRIGLAEIDDGHDFSEIIKSEKTNSDNTKSEKLETENTK